jgi:hypothetical protein
VFDAVALAETEPDGVADADPDADADGFWLRGTTTTGVPPEFGVTMNCDPGLWAVVLCGTIALDPITTTLAVAAVVTPTSNPATTTVFEVAPASAVGKCNAANFTVSPPLGHSAERLVTSGYSIRRVPSRSLSVVESSERLIVMPTLRHKSPQT